MLQGTKNSARRYGLRAMAASVIALVGIGAMAQPFTSRLGSAHAANGTAAALSFKKDIQPIFAAHCATCHIATNLGGLNLKSYQGLLKGGNIVNGSVIVPKNHAKSVIWKITQPKGPWPGGNRMPLGGPYLSPALESKIATWIDQGAKNN